MDVADENLWHYGALYNSTCLPSHRTTSPTRPKCPVSCPALSLRWSRRSCGIRTYCPMRSLRSHLTDTPSLSRDTTKVFTSFSGDRIETSTITMKPRETIGRHPIVRNPHRLQRCRSRGSHTLADIPNTSLTELLRVSSLDRPQSITASFSIGILRIAGGVSHFDFGDTPAAVSHASFCSAGASSAIFRTVAVGIGRSPRSHLAKELSGSTPRNRAKGT